MTKEDRKLIKKFLEKRVNIYNRANQENMKFCFTEGLKVKNREIKKLKTQIEKMKCCINDLVHLGEFDEYTDEEYLNYQVHEALKNAEQFLKEE